MMKKQKIYHNLSTLLANRGWNKSETSSKFDIYLPPLDIDIDKDYKFHLYNKFDYSDFEKTILRGIDILTQIYVDDDIDDLGTIIIDNKQVLSFHIFDESIINGKPSIPFFSDLISNARELLEQTAYFSVIKKPHFFDVGEESERYLNYCKFLKNDVGSLITKIQLPKDEFIVDKTLFEKGLAGSQINHNLMNITDFVNNEILSQDDIESDDDFLSSNKSNISVNVNNKLKKIYEKIDYSDIEFTLKDTEKTLKSTATNLSKQKIDKIGCFSKMVREKMKEISEDYIEIKGNIIKLQSKDIESDNNSITMLTTIKNVKKNVSVKLSSNQMKQATDAFKGNKKVKLQCKLEKEKTQYKVIELRKIEIE